MAKRTGRPPKPKSDRKVRYLQVRVDDAEKAAFDRATGLSGIDLSSWVRERLRGIARKEIMAVGEKAAFDLEK